MDNFNKISTANDRLTEFGLNPNQWKIFKQTSRIYKIQNLKSKSLVLAGHWGHGYWKSIWLVSI